MATFQEEKDSPILDDDRISTLLAKHSQLNSSIPISFEYYPPKTEQGKIQLYKVMEELKEYNGLFIDITWGAGGSTSTLTQEIAKYGKQKLNVPVNMHLTCTNMEKSMIELALEECKDSGIKNILALRGDPPAGQDRWTASEGGFQCAKDLVHFIRSKYDDYFHISVAGYPEGHPVKMTLLKDEEVENLSETEIARMSIDIDPTTSEKSIWVCKDADFEEELDYLKEKVDAGASCIITQMFYDCDVYNSFVTACRRKNILVPIVPGIMPIATYSGFKRMIKFCKTRVPESIMNEIEALKDDEKGITEYGRKFATLMCKKLIAYSAPLLHFYTLNFSTEVIAILKELEHYPMTSSNVVSN